MGLFYKRKKEINMLSLIFSIFSLVVAVGSFGLNYSKYKREMQNQALFSNENHIIEIESRTAMHPEFLRFHGIENPDAFLEEHGITPQEFAYLLNSFTAGSLFYNTANKKKKDVILKPNSYRWIMCKSPSVRKAWPAIKILLAPGEYRDKLEKIIYEK